MQKESPRRPLADWHARLLTPAKTQTFAFEYGLTMRDRDHDVSTEIFASMCHPRFSEFDPTDVNDELSDAVIKHQIQ